MKNIIVMILLMAILGTGNEIWGCDWSSNINNNCTIHLYYRELTKRDFVLELKHSRKSFFLTISRDIRTEIASLESSKEFADANTIKEINEELDDLYLQLYMKGVEIDFFIE